MRGLDINSSYTIYDLLNEQKKQGSTGNLDSKNGKEVMELLNELNKEGTTIVMVTHSQHDAGFAGRIINLFDGQVVTEANL